MTLATVDAVYVGDDGHPYYDPRMPRGEPKVMFSVRLPGDLVDRIVEAAEDAGESRATLSERAFEGELERMAEPAGSGVVG